MPPNPQRENSVQLVPRTALDPSRLHRPTHSQVIAGIVVGVLALALRVLHLDSDAYPRLSWSSGLLTDEGFYIHNARNLVLFGRERTDEFNNALIMPVLHAVQVGVFRLAGVGAVQARSISVFAALLTAILLVDALRRAFDMRVAAVAGVVMALDHVPLLYSRLALMDTPAACVLTGAFWAFVRALPEEETPESTLSPGWLFAAGALLGISYGVRGLCALVFAAPLAALWGRGRVGLIPFLAGLLGVLAVYGAFWWLPNRTELHRLNTYYVGQQLIPHSGRALRHTLWSAAFGDGRGLSSFLWRHAPVTWGLGVLWLLGGRRASLSGFRDRRASYFLTGWLAILVVFLCVINYSPSRYYVLFYPALASVAGLALVHGKDVWRASTASWSRRAFLAGYLGYHVLAVAMARAGLPQGPWLWGLSGAVAVTAAGAPRISVWNGVAKTRHGMLRCEPRAFAAACVLLWLISNACWTVDWLRHLTYRQEGADRWLAEHLPPGSVLLGAVAPGLCLNNRFVAVNMIQKLCNDDRPVERAGPAARYILILDDKWKEGWWIRRYPDLVAPSRRVHSFKGLLRPFFVIGLYRADPPSSAVPTTSAVENSDAGKAAMIR